MSLPKVWLWTAWLNWDLCIKIIENSIDIWYDLIDTAENYKNEKEIGLVVSKFWDYRNKLHIISKIAHDNAKNINWQIEERFNYLNVDYIDTILIHWPKGTYSNLKIYESLLHYKNLWKILNIWVSNFNIKDLSEIEKEFPWEVSINEIEVHPFLEQTNLIGYCRSKSINIIAYSPFAEWLVFKNKVLSDISISYWKTISQITLKYITQKYWFTVIPKTSNLFHLKENLDINDFELSLETISKIDSLPKHIRQCDNSDSKIVWDD